MRTRYVFETELATSAGRLARHLFNHLSTEASLKAELKAEPYNGHLSAEWQDLYALSSRPLFQPQVQLYHGPVARYQPHPLQWNILVDPAELPAALNADEVWVFSEARKQLLQAQTQLPVVCLPPTADLGLLGSALQPPIEQEAEKMVLCVWPAEQLSALEGALSAYCQAYGQSAAHMLALYLLSPQPQEQLEEQLISLVERVCETTSTPMDSLNIGTWIGPLERDAYLSLLQACERLICPLDSQAAVEALALGKLVPACLEQPLPWSAEVLSEALTAEPKAQELPVAPVLAAWQQRLQVLATEFDPATRQQAYAEAQEAQRQQGRKQKYSLFHSDYNPQEMQARRQWHRRYAEMLVGCPGDILDIGSGSGIFLEIMRDDLHLPAFGLDPDPDMVAVCQKLKLQALAGDERRLAEFDPESLGGIHASHVIEHVDGERAIALIENALRVLRPGGRLLVRTPNWRNQTVRHEGFWLDITHIRPYPLPLLEQVFKDSGFEVIQAGFEDFGWNDTFILGQKPGGQHV